MRVCEFERVCVCVRERERERESERECERERVCVCVIASDVDIPKASKKEAFFGWVHVFIQGAVGVWTGVAIPGEETIHVCVRVRLCV